MGGFSFAVQVLDRQNQDNNLRFPRASSTSLNFKGETEVQTHPEKRSLFHGTILPPVLGLVDNRRRLHGLTRKIQRFEPA